MTSSREVKAVEIGNASDIDFVLPNGFSFFESYLQYFLRETLGAGGEAYVSKTSEGTITGIFLYDDADEKGTTNTKSKEDFDYSNELNPTNFLFHEPNTTQ